MEFLGGIAKSGGADGTVRLSPAFIQPIASDDVADVVADHALATPVNGIVEVAGPERFRMTDIVQRYLDAVGESSKVVADTSARYFGAALEDDTLVPSGTSRLGAVSFDAWMRQSKA